MGNRTQNHKPTEVLMLKNLSQLEVSIEGKSYRFHCDIDSPLAAVKEALFQFQKYIGQVEDQINSQKEAEKAKKLEEESKTVEEPKPE